MPLVLSILSYSIVICPTIWGVKVMFGTFSSRKKICMSKSFVQNSTLPLKSGVILKPTKKTLLVKYRASFTPLIEGSKLVMNSGKTLQDSSDQNTFDSFFSEAYWNCPQRLQRPQVAAYPSNWVKPSKGGFFKVMKVSKG